MGSLGKVCLINSYIGGSRLLTSSLLVAMMRDSITLCCFAYRSGCLLGSLSFPWFSIGNRGIQGNVKVSAMLV